MTYHIHHDAMLERIFRWNITEYILENIRQIVGVRRSTDIFVAEVDPVVIVGIGINRESVDVSFGCLPGVESAVDRSM